MLRLQPKGPDLWDSILPKEVRQLPEELDRVNQILDDERLMEPFEKRFATKMGRPTIPVATYVRMMYLKFRYKLGYETLVSEVSDSISWRIFCGIGCQGKVPDASTLIKLTHKYGEDILKEMHGLIVENLREKKLIRGRKIRMDTTVVESDIHYPTDMTLHRDGLKRMRGIITKIGGLGIRIGRTLRKVKELNFTGSQWLRKRGKKAQEKVEKINRGIMKITRKAIERVKEIVPKIKDARNRQKLEETMGIVDKMSRQSEERLNGGKPTERIVSIVDPEARPIKKGKLDKPVEFGRTAEIVQDQSGYITQYEVFKGNPPETGMLMDIVKGHQKQFGEAVVVAADTGFASADNFAKLEAMGIKRIGIPSRGKPPLEVQRRQETKWFKALRNFRAGIEAIIRFLDRKFGFKRSMYRGNAGTSIWVSWVMISANLYRYARIP